MDQYDRAQELDAMFLRQALEAQRRRAALQPGAAAGDWQRLSAILCEGTHCGELIPDSRRQALPGVRLCLGCQERQERLKK